MQNQLNTSNTNLITKQSKILPSKLNIRKLSLDKAFDIVAKLEGLRLQAYKCPANVWTVGYGITVIDNKPITKDTVITKEQAKEYLCDYLSKSLDTIWKDVMNCNSNQIAAILSFVYNCGKGAWDKSGLRRAVVANPNNFQAISIEFKKWTKVNGKVMQGLVNRREAEIKLYCS